MTSINPWLNQLPKYALLRNDERKAALKAAGKQIYDFGIGDPVEETPYFIRQALIDAIPKVSQYPTALGSVVLRQACSAWLQRRFDVSLDPVLQIVSSNGSKEAIFHIPQVLLNAASTRRVVVLPDPGFPVYKGATLLAGGLSYEVPLLPENNFVFSPDQIPEALLPHVAACWVCYPHNPTGALISHAQAQKIYDWAVKHDIVLLSDECYVDMYFPGSTPPLSFLSIAKQNDFKNLLCFFSLSKRSGMTGFRSGFVAGDTKLIAHFAKYRPHAGLGTPDFVQAAASKAWLDDAHVVQRNEIFARKRQVVDNFLKKNNLFALPSTATFYVWVQVPQGSPAGSSGEQYAQKIADTCGMVVTPGDALGLSCDSWFRLALVPNLAAIQESLQLWQRAIDSKFL